MFDLNNTDTISKIGFHHAAIKMSEMESWDIVEKCHKHYERIKQIQAKIDSIRKKIHY
jgi:NTE family protein